MHQFNRLRPLIAALVPAVLFFHVPRTSAQDLATFQVFQSGLIAPCFLDSPPGEPERILVASLSGVIRVIENGVLLPTPFLDIRSRVRLDHGLIGVAFSPDYATSRRFYVHYTPAEAATTRIARYTASSNPNVADSSEEILLQTGEGGGDHNSGWMDFGPDGYLYIARGDSGGSPQNPDQPQGKLLRIDVSTAKGYAVPPDNPYVGTQGLDEIVAIGLRNPWRNSFDPLTGDLYIADVGTIVYEEINFVPHGTIVGRNFGWPCVEGIECRSACPCSFPPMTIPVYSYPRNVGSCVIGGYVYRGISLPRWRGRYFFMDFEGNRLWSFRVVDGVSVDLQTHHEALNAGLSPAPPLTGGISFGVDAQGEMYALELGGRILKIVPEFAPADWNLDGVTNSSDFFAFLVDFFELNADMTGDHATNSQDFFEYLLYFFGQ